MYQHKRLLPWVGAQPREDVMVKRGEPIPADSTGPIFVCTRNDSLAGIVESCPPARREDLVFLQNGMLQPWLDAQGIGDNTQVRGRMTMTGA